jgi:hypothetical protein
MAIPAMTPSAPALDDPDFYLAGPHAAFRWMREYALVYRCERARLWAISKHADIPLDAHERPRPDARHLRRTMTRR